jgi:hypothetical protein
VIEDHRAGEVIRNSKSVRMLGVSTTDTEGHHGTRDERGTGVEVDRGRDLRDRVDLDAIGLGDGIDEREL